MGAIADMISQISADERAIGYETLWMTRLFLQKGRVKVLKINGHDPNNPSHIVSVKYPLYRVYNLTTWEGQGVADPIAQKLVNYLLQQVEHLDSKFSLIPASHLRRTGWKFKGDELVGEPE